MKNLIKTTVLFLLTLTISIFVKAQPKPGSMIFGQFESNIKNMFVASVVSSDSKGFTCRFVQSNSIYIFKITEPGEGIVVSNKGGKYPSGAKFMFVEYNIVDDTYGCILNKIESSVVITKFDDGKSFLGYTGDFKVDGNFKVGFWHSGSTYTFDKNGFVMFQKGGTYAKGRTAKIFCAELSGPVPVGMALPNLEKDIKQ